MTEREPEVSIPVAALCEKLGELAKIPSIHLVKPLQHGAVDVDDGDKLAGLDNWDNDLTFAVAVACYVAGELIDVRYELRLIC